MDTRVPDRDKDLRSSNFFDAEKYPTIEFKSKRIVNNGGKLQMVGDLTMHGTTREVTLDLDSPTAELTDTSGNQTARIFGIDHDQPEGLRRGVES